MAPRSGDALWKLFVLVLVLSLVITGCGPASPPTPTDISPPPPTFTPVPSPTPGISPEALDYLNTVLDLVKENALHRELVNWEHMTDTIMNAETEAVTTADTYDSIIYVVGQLKDNHSHFLNPNEAEEFNNLDLSDYQNPYPLAEYRLGKFAYLQIPQFASGDSNANMGFANRIRYHLVQLDQRDICGWVIDLRDNLGGNLGPMLAGVSPLLGDGPVGGFMDVNGNLEKISIVDGQVAGFPDLDLTVNYPYEFQNADLPIAILIGPQTASSGEMLALAFRGMPNTILYGNETAGYTTSNDKFELTDGAILLLTTSVFVDREGTTYGGSIVPDLSEDSIYSYPLAIPPDIIDWLNNQKSCQVED